VATRAQKTKVGLFLILCTALIVVGLVMVSGYKREVRIPYWIEFEESVLGLSDGATVEYLGVPVGSVENIYVTDHGHAHVDIMVAPDKVRLREGVEGRTVLLSFATGMLAIELRGGRLDAPVLPANSQIPSRASLVAAVSSRMEGLLDSITEVGDMIRQGLEGLEKGELAAIAKNVDVVLEDAHAFLEEATETVDGVETEVRKGLDEFTQLTAELRQLADETQQTVTSVRQKVEKFNVESTQDRVSEVFDRVSELAERLNQTVETLDTVSRSALNEVDNVEYGLRETLRTATETLESIRALTNSLEEDPGQILRGKGKPSGGN